MKVKKALLFLILLWSVAHISIGQDFEKIMDFQPVKFKYFHKSPTKRIFFYQFDIGYVVQSYARHGAADIMPVLDGLSEDDFQRITDRVYETVVKQWEEAGYEVLDIAALQESRAFQKYLKKGKCEKNAPSFGWRDEQYQFGEQSFISSKYKGKAEQKVVYFNPEGHLTTSDRGQPENLGASLQYGVISKELNAVAVNFHLKLDFVDYSGQETYGSDKIYSTVTGSPILSADNYINLNYTTPKGYMATAMMDNYKGEVYGGSGYLKDIQNLGDCLRKNCPEKALLDQRVNANRLFRVEPEAYENDVLAIATRIMQYFMDKFQAEVKDNER